jgi:hypothetical protein
MGRVIAPFVAVVAASVVVGAAADRTSGASAPDRGTIAPAHDTLSFCIELHSGRREFQVRLRNTRGVATRVAVSVERAPRLHFTLAASARVQVLRGAWNGKHHSGGCRATIAWDHAQLVLTLPLAQE